MADGGLPATTSASQLVSYSMCPRKYACQYVLGLEPEFTSTALIVGSVVHSGIEWWFGERLLGGSPTIEQALEIVAADFTAATADVRVRWKDHTPESLENQVRELIRTYLTEHGDLPVVAIEQPFEVDLEDPMDPARTLPRKLRGYFDLVLEDTTVVELKTSAKGWPESFLVRHLQIGAYAFAWNVHHGGPCQLDVHVVIKTKKPRVEAHRIERGEPGTKWWFEATAAIEAAILAGHFPPSPGPLCMECEFQGACSRWDQAPEVLQPRRALPVLQQPGALAYTL